MGFRMVILGGVSYEFTREAAGGGGARGAALGGEPAFGGWVGIGLVLHAVDQAANPSPAARKHESSTGATVGQTVGT